VAGTLRITGGSLVRRIIDVPPGADRHLVRPTSDKVREAVMSSLMGRIEETAVLDLFAGSGALGIEALSRGAARCTFVEKDKKTAGVIEANLRALDLLGRSRVVVDDAARFLKSAKPGSFGLVFLDPPYTTPVARLRAGLARVLARGGALVVERDKRSTEDAPPGLKPVRDRLYGDTRVIVYEVPMPTSVPSAKHISAAIYPGSFDPLTNGHVDIVRRGLNTFDRVVLAIANNVQKAPLFSIAERLAQAKECFGDMPGLEIDTFDGLVVDYAKKKGVGVLLRGLRAVSDFEYEFQLASMNRKLMPDVDTVFMMTSEESFYLSSRLVREVASFGGNIESMVPAPVHVALRARYKNRGAK
jgi:pantetheine-phosphate adenylyltransferase